MAQVPSYFIRTRNVSNSVAGAFLLPTVLGIVVGALIGGSIINEDDETWRRVLSRLEKQGSI